MDEGRTVMPRKRATMIDSDEDDEEGDLLSDSSRPVLKKTRRDVEDTPGGPEDLIKTLTKAGFYPRSGNLPNILSVRGSEFQQSLREHFSSSINHPRSIELFMSECDTFFNSRDNFIKALHPTQNATTLEDSTAMVLTQDSLVRLLLNIEEIQPYLVQSVLKRFADASKEERRQDCTEENLPSLILSQLAWLNRIVDPVYVVDTLLDLLHSSRPAIQKEIISQLPGLVSDREQIRVAFALCELLDDSDAQHSLTAAVLDTLGDLSLPTIEAAELRAKVAKRISNVPLETMPPLVTFLFKREDNEESASLVREVRRNFDRACGRNRQRHSHSEEMHNYCLSLAVESLQASLVSSKALADTWFKEIQAEVESTNHHCVDFLVLLIEHKLSTRPKLFEDLLKLKLQNESISADLVKDAFKLYGFVLKNYFDELRAVAYSLLLSKDPLMIPHGLLIYSEMFSLLDGIHQEKEVKTLIQEICCIGGGASEGGGAAESIAIASIVLLQELADNHLEILCKCSDPVFALLGNLKNLSVLLVKKVTPLLAKMAYGYPDSHQPRSRSDGFASSHSFQSTLLCTVLNLLNSSLLEHQRTGALVVAALVGALSYTGWMGCADRQLAPVRKALRGEVKKEMALLNQKERLESAKGLIDCVLSHIERAPEIVEIFMVEITNPSRLDVMHSAIYSYIYKKVLIPLMEAFVVYKHCEPLLDGFPVKMEIQYGLDTLVTDDEPAFVNIGPMTFIEASRKPGDRSNIKDSTSCLVSHIRLLRRKMESSDLSDFKKYSLLRCALCLPDDDVLTSDQFDGLAQPDKDAVCRSLYHAVNWLIEVINTFAPVTHLRAEVLQRVRDVILLKEKFYRYLNRNPTFVPPPSVCYREPIRSSAQQPLDSLTDTNPLDFIGSRNGPSTSEAADKSDQSTFIVHFRELEKSAILLFTSSLDLSTSSTPSSSLNPKELEFLLTDLSEKVQHKLIPSAANLRFESSTGPGSEVGESVSDILDLQRPLEVAKGCVSLIGHVASIHGFFHQLNQKNAGLLDAASISAEPASCLARCNDLILRILRRIFYCHGLEETSTGTLLKEDSLCVFAGRIQPEEAETAVINELTTLCFTYIEKISRSVSTFDCAVEHVRLAAALLRHLPEPDAELADKLAMMAEGYLKRGWTSPDGKPVRVDNKFNAGVEYLLQVYLSSGTGTLDKVKRIAKTTVPELLRSGGTADGFGRESLQSESFRTCNKSTYAVYLRAAFLALVESAQKMTGTIGMGTAQDELNSWGRVLELLYELMPSVMKNTKQHSVLSDCLKRGRVITDLFIQLAMPLLSIQLEQPQELFRNNNNHIDKSFKQFCADVGAYWDPMLAYQILLWKKCQEQLLGVQDILYSVGRSEAEVEGENDDVAGLKEVDGDVRLDTAASDRSNNYSIWHNMERWEQTFLLCGLDGPTAAAVAFNMATLEESSKAFGVSVLSF